MSVRFEHVLCRGSTDSSPERDDVAAELRLTPDPVQSNEQKGEDLMMAEGHSARAHVY